MTLTGGTLAKSETLKDRKEAKDIHEHKNDHNDEDLGLAWLLLSFITYLLMYASFHA